MSRSSDAAWGDNGKGAWRDASVGRRCPVCNGKSWCAVHRVEPVVLCRRVASEREKEGVDGSRYWVHRLDGGAWSVEEIRADAPSIVCAPIDVRDRAYRAVLDALDLCDAHRDGLRARGLCDDGIDANGYRTLPREGRSALARAMADAVGSAATGVPGYRVAREDGREWATLGGSAGLLIPVRDVAGRVEALKVRRDDAGEGPRYLYVSSSRHGGASAPNAVHVPRGTRRGGVVRVTEGELKADVCAALSRAPTVSVPGVGAWRGVRPVLDALGATTVWVAYDADAAENAHVAGALRDLTRALEVDGFDVYVERWDASQGNGIDDVLAARARAA